MDICILLKILYPVCCLLVRCIDHNEHWALRLLHEYWNWHIFYSHLLCFGFGFSINNFLYEPSKAKCETLLHEKCTLYLSIIHPLQDVALCQIPQWCPFLGHSGPALHADIFIPGPSFLWSTSGSFPKSVLPFYASYCLSIVSGPVLSLRSSLHHPSIFSFGYNL